VYLGLPQITSRVDPLDRFPEECYWSGPDEAPSGTSEDCHGALRDINGDSPFTQPPHKVVEVWLQVANEQRQLAGRGYDSSVVRVEGSSKAPGTDLINMQTTLIDMQIALIDLINMQISLIDLINIQNGLIDLSNMQISFIDLINM
jgi:biotin carboxylase